MRDNVNKFVSKNKDTNITEVVIQTFLDKAMIGYSATKIKVTTRETNPNGINNFMPIWLEKDGENISDIFLNREGVIGLRKACDEWLRNQSKQKTSAVKKRLRK